MPVLFTMHCLFCTMCFSLCIMEGWSDFHFTYCCFYLDCLSFIIFVGSCISVCVREREIVKSACLGLKIGLPAIVMETGDQNFVVSFWHIYKLFKQIREIRFWKLFIIKYYRPLA